MENSTALPPIPGDIANTTAPQMFGILINWMLFGVLSVQVYVYHLNFPNDRKWNKIIVYGSYTVEMVQTGMSAADLYFWYGTGFGNLNHLGNVNISPIDTPILCGIIAAIVQCFFAYRIFTMRRSFLWISILIVLTSILQTGGTFGAGIRGLKLQEYSRFHEEVGILQSVYIWLLGDMVCDILIAGTMLWLFYMSRQEGPLHGSRILGKLVRLIVETNTLTAGMAILSLICYVALPNSPVYVCMTVVMGKLYSNTLLVTFNNRIALRKDTVYDSGGRVPLPIRRPNDFDSEVSTFHVASERLGGKSVGVESSTLTSQEENKERDLMSRPVFSVV